MSTNATTGGEVEVATSSKAASPSPEAQAAAEEYRRRARELMAEARAMETALEASRSSQEKKKQVETADLIHRLFLPNRPFTPAAVARVLREERWSVEQLLVVLEHLYQQQRTFNATTATPLLVEKTFQIASTSNAAEVPMNQTEYELVEAYVQCILEAAALLDQDVEPTGRHQSHNNNEDRNLRWSGRGSQTLRAQLNEWRRADKEEFKRRLAADVTAALTSNTSVQDYMRQTLGLAPKASAADRSSALSAELNATLERVVKIPLWVPSSLVEIMIATRALLDAADVKAIKDRVLPSSRFYCTSTDSIPSAAVFRGNIRSQGSVVSSLDDKNVTGDVFAEIQEQMKREGISSRVQLFLMEDPEWRPNRDERETAPKPIILAIPAGVVPGKIKPEQRRGQAIWPKVSAALAVASTFSFSINCYALNQKFFESIVNRQDMTALVACLPVFLGVCAVTAVHELAHRLVARWRGMKIGLPTPLPSTQFGLFGCITPLRSFPSNRAALLDFALSGPIASTVVSVLLMVFGINQTVHASPAALQQFPVVPVSLLKSSFLTGSLLTFLAPKVMMLPISQPIPIHPCLMIGFSGLIASALNLLPIFRLDGGRACSAAMGPRFGAIASAWTLLLLLSAALSGSTRLAWVWGFMVLVFQRRPEIPVRDDATEVDDFRLGAWVVSVATSLLALAPFPGGPGLL